jgi:hypothetical protein
LKGDKMIGRMIPAKIVQEHLDKIVNSDDKFLATIKAGEDMGLLKVDKMDDDGRPTEITWIKL